MKQERSKAEPPAAAPDAGRIEKVNESQPARSSRLTGLKDISEIDRQEGNMNHGECGDCFGHSEKEREEAQGRS